MVYSTHFQHGGCAKKSVVQPEAHRIASEAKKVFIKPRISKVSAVFFYTHKIFKINTE